MSVKNDGGPAFPGAKIYDGEPDCGTSGMSLRDWYIGQAIAGLLSNANLMDHLNGGDDPLSDEAFIVSVVCGARRYADAMLAERTK